MDTVHINWYEVVTRINWIKDSKRTELDKKGFYAILGATHNAKSNKWENIKLLYIGQAFDQTLRERIPQEHEAYKCVFKYQKDHSGVGIVVMVGIIKNPSVQKLTQQLFDDTECCLVFHNKPLCNTTCKESYSGRDIKVINIGHPYPLEKESTCSKTKEE